LNRTACETEHNKKKSLGIGKKGKPYGEPGCFRGFLKCEEVFTAI